VTQVRSALRVLGAPARLALIGLIKGYRATLSGWLGGQCRFSPTCSHYAEEAIRARGALVGTALAVWRVGRCNPFGAGGIDPVPVRAGRHKTYDKGYDDVTLAPRANRRRGAAA
jgi:putative membrane protein insertion efficiency factor